MDCCQHECSRMVARAACAVLMQIRQDHECSNIDLKLSGACQQNDYNAQKSNGERLHGSDQRTCRSAAHCNLSACRRPRVTC